MLPATCSFSPREVVPIPTLSVTSTDMTVSEKLTVPVVEFIEITGALDMRYIAKLNPGYAIESRSERHKGVPDVDSRRKMYRRHPALLRGHYGEERIFEQARRWCDFGPRSRVAIAYSGLKPQFALLDDLPPG